MDNNKLEQFKGLLLAEQQRLEQELADLGSRDSERPDAEYPESGSNQDEDNTAEMIEFADMISVEARVESELKDVNKALDAIQKGKYGICKYCGKEIDEKRLLARPASSSCIDCKKTLTQEM